MAGCCQGKKGCIGGWLIALGVLSLGWLPLSIPTIILGCILAGCCCQDGGGCNVKSLSTTVVVIGAISTVLGLLYGILMFSVLGDVYCAGIYNMDLEFYQNGGKELADGFCSQCGQGYDWLLGEVCERRSACDMMSGFGGAVIAGAFLIDLPITILAAMACCDKNIAAPPGGGVTMTSASGTV